MSGYSSFGSGDSSGSSQMSPATENFARELQMEQQKMLVQVCILFF